MAKVYVLNHSGHDYTPANKYGEIVFCTSGNIDKNDVASMFRELNHAMKDAHEDDFIVVGSLTSMCSVATGILADRFGKVNFLLYDKGDYLARTVVFDSIYEG